MSETVAFLDALYSRCEPDDGQIIVVPKHEKKCEALLRVGLSQRLVDAAKFLDGKPDRYLKINLFDGGAVHARGLQSGKWPYVVGRLDEVKTVVSFHLDVDAGKNDKYLSRQDILDCLAAMPHQPSLIVNSDGDAGGFHAYWLFGEPIRIDSDDHRKRIGEIANRWQARLNDLTGGKLDATADLTRMLRVVGQQRSNGNWVTCHSHDPSLLYSLSDLTLPKSKSDIDHAAKQRVRAIVRETLPETIERTGQPISDYIDASGITVEQLFSEQGWTGKPNGDWVRPESESGAKTARIATTHERPGANFFSGNETRFPCTNRDGSVGRYHSIDEIFVVLRHGGDWKAAAAWCREQIAAKQNEGVDLSNLAPRRQSA